MKFITFFFIITFLSSCASNKTTYWCGDHPCINKEEKEAYFKKTMIVETKDDFIINKNNQSKIEEILKQAKMSEKLRISEEKISKKK